MPPKLGIMNQGTFYWRYSDRDPEWKVLKKYDTETGLTCEAKLIKKLRKEEETNMAKFEIGDKVKIVKLDCNWWFWVPQLAQYIDKTGKIKKILNEYGEARCTVDFNNDCWCFPEDWLELVEKAKKYWSGKVVCIHTESEAYFIVGKVYTVKNGKIFGEDHFAVQTTKTEPITELNLGDISWCPLMPHVFDGTKFIDFKGFADQE